MGQWAKWQADNYVILSKGKVHKKEKCKSVFSKMTAINENLWI